MLHPDDDIGAQCALQKLSNCTNCLLKYQTAVRSLIDDIHIAEGNGETSQKMSLWVQGRYTIYGIRVELLRHIHDAEIFLGSDDYDTLDSSKRGEYFDVMIRIGKDHEKIEKEYMYYALLGNIEYAERSIHDLERILKRSYHHMIYKKGVGTLKSRGLRRYRKRIDILENHIQAASKKIIQKIELVISHPFFKKMSPEKRDEYNKKWKYYQNEIGKDDTV